MQKKRGSSATERRYTRELFRFYLWLQHRGKEGLKSVTPRDIESYLQFCITPPDSWCGNTGGAVKISDPDWRPFKSRPLYSSSRFGSKPSVNTIQNTSSILKSFFSYLVKQGYLRGDPTDSISGEYRPSVMSAKAAKATVGNLDYPCRPPSLPEGLSDAQWLCLQETIDLMPRETPAQELKYHRAEFVLKLLYYAGLRSEEARTHTHKALRFDNRYGCWKLVIYGKGSKMREIPVHPVLLAAFRRYRAFLGLPDLPRSQYTDQVVDHDDIPLFPPYKPFKTDDSGKIVEIYPSISERTADEWIKSLYKNAEKRMKLSYANEMAKTAISFASATLHTIRHTRARHMLFREKMDVRVVQAFLGHSKILTTQIYTEPTLGELYEGATKVES